MVCAGGDVGWSVDTAGITSGVRVIWCVQVAMLVGQSILLGLLVDYFTEVSSEQVRQDCFGEESPSTSSSRDAYLAALGEKSSCYACRVHAACI